MTAHAPTSRTPVDHALRLMGTHIRIVVGSPMNDDVPAPAEAAARVEALLRDYDAALSRFRPGSEMSRLNADPRVDVRASDLLCSAIEAAVAAAEQTRGLVDPTLLGHLERAGYTQTWDADRRVELREALADPHRPAAAPAHAHDGAYWRQVRVDRESGRIRRPAGLRLDTGGTGKGHAADLCAPLLRGYDAWAVDCGGDVRVGGEAGLVRDVEVEHPFTGELFDVIRVRDGAVATSGLRSRIWRREDGTIAHHLIDPATGQPAFTGLVAATAVAPTAVQAEALAKAALLSGPHGARAILSAGGGITVDEDGNVERIGRLEPPPRVTFTLNGARLS